MEFRLLKKADIIIAAAILLASGLLWFFIHSGSDKLTAEISVDGKVVETIRLDEITGRKEIRLDTDPEVLIVAEDGSIRFEEAGCRDRICVNAGKLYRKGDTAVCLPARTVVTITGSDLDAVTY